LTLVKKISQPQGLVRKASYLVFIYSFF
jgi:hypothetical protein